MKLEDQVCSLELAKKLKEVGVKQESLWCWGEFFNTSSTVPEKRLSEVFLSWDKEDFRDRPFLGDLKFYSAITVAELGAILPFEACFLKLNGTWKVEALLDINVEVPCIYDEREANARAKVLIYLIENKLIDVKEINK